MKDEYQQRILTAISERLPAGVQGCPLCGAKKWTLVDGFTLFPIQPEPGGAFNLGGPAAPSIGLICNNCGNTHFLNLMILGLGDLVEQARLEAEESPFWRAQRLREEENKK